METELTPELKTLIRCTREARLEMEHRRRLYYAKCGSYEAMLRAAEAFCAAFEHYHFAKTGKRKRLNPHTVLR